jgi:tRNA(Ile)-lysidine synthase
LALLARAANLVATLHHVDHHLRATSGDDAALVNELARDLDFAVVQHDVVVVPGANLEARARAARRAALPERVMTAHTMDDQAETVLVNLLRGAGLDGLSPMTFDPTKPLVGLRRSALLAYVESTGRKFVIDETNSDVRFLRNRIRHELLPSLEAAANRDLVTLWARQATVIAEERQLLDQLLADDAKLTLDAADCRELREWSEARLRRWLRRVLAREDVDGRHAPSVDELERAIEVVRGTHIATELGGGRRLARKAQRLSLDL